MKKIIKAEKESLRSVLFILIGLFIITFIFMMQSPLNILCLNGNSGTDSSVFRTIAMQMRNGLMPYRDSFDHKGPLTYLYNYWGILIRPCRGVWIIEFISVFVSFGFMYKIATLKCGKLQAFLIIMICIVPLYTYFEGGNFTEEYALPYVTIATYIFADYFINEKISRIRLIICGMSFGAVCMLRINMIAVWIVFCCAVLLHKGITKKLSVIPQYLFWFLGGVGVIIIPICCWLIINNAFIDFINDYFIFNTMYTQDTNRATLLNKYNSFSYFLNNVYVLTAIIVTCCLMKSEKFFHVTYLVYEIVSLLLICLSGQKYPHYGMILIPMLVYPFAALLSKETLHEKPWILTFVMYFFVIQGIPVWIKGVNTMAEYCLMENKTRERTDLVGKVCTFITENSNENDRIIVCGNWNVIYVNSQRLPASKYSYQLPIGDVDKRIMNEFFEEINNTNPPLVVIAKNVEIENLEDFLNENNYICSYEIDGVMVYMQKI